MQWFPMVLSFFNGDLFFSVVFMSSQWLPVVCNFLNCSQRLSVCYQCFSVIFTSSYLFSVVLIDYDAVILNGYQCFSIVLKGCQWLTVFLSNFHWFLVVLNGSH